jgi:hypothetical protein
MSRYSRATSIDVEGAMHKRKRGTLKSGSGRKAMSRKQAIAVGLSEARKNAPSHCRFPDNPILPYHREPTFANATMSSKSPLHLHDVIHRHYSPIK